MKSIKHLSILFLSVFFVMCLVVLKPTSAMATGSAVYISPDKFTLKVGEKKTIEMFVRGTACSADKWTSSDTKVATVNKDGVVTAKKAGTATITCKTGFGYNLKAKVTVKGNSSEKIDLSKYLQETYTKLAKKITKAKKLSKAEDPAGKGNVYVFKTKEETSLFFRYDTKSKKITELQNDNDKNLTLYGVTLGSKYSAAKKALEGKKFKYKEDKTTDIENRQIPVFTKKGEEVVLYIDDGKVTCFQWHRKK